MDKKKSLYISNSKSIKIFIVRLIFFLILITAVLLLISVYNLRQIQKGPNLSKHNFVLGDSHPMRAIHPDVFYNWDFLTNPSEPYSITFLKLKFLLNSNVRIDSIILGYSIHSLSSFNDKKLFGPQGVFQFNKTYAILINSSMGGIPYSRKQYQQVLFKKIALIPNRTPFEEIGHFAYAQSKIDKNRCVNPTIERHFYPDGELASFSTLNYIYLEKIIEICMDNGINISLIGIPVTKEYISSAPVTFKNLYDSMSTVLISKHGVNIIDCTEYALVDKFYYNFDHLNSQGALHFSKILRKNLSPR